MQISKLFHWKATPTRAFNEFLYEFLRIFLISENSLKFAIFFAEVTNSRSMDLMWNFHDIFVLVPQLCDCVLNLV